MARGSASIVEVAKVAGVSTATVSRVLNGLPGVRAATVAQVQAAVDNLHYTRLRSRSARARRAGRPASKLVTGTIAVLTLGHGHTWFELPVMGSVLGGIQRGANANNLRLLLGEVAHPTEPSPLLVDRQVDGAIVFLSSDLPVATYEATFKAMQRHAPVVWAMGMDMAFNEVDHVAPNNVGIGFLASDYLQRLGCQRPAFLTADPGWPLMRLRGQSFLNTAFDAGATPTTYVVADNERMAHRYGRRVVYAPRLADLIAKLASAIPRPDGLFIGNDLTTQLVYPLLAQHGLRVGTDLHVVSCDAEQARLSGLHPRPASIDIGGDEIGYRCVNRLLNRIERPHGPPLIIQVTPRLQLPPAPAH
jgi:DNA-binding LacI/PurR family transcriptional regulator